MRQRLHHALVLGAVTAVSVIGGGCGGDRGTEDAAGPTVVVTTTILGDIVRQVVGDSAEVEVVMPAGADPHDFAASARQTERMAEADLLVVNGAGFEEGLDRVIDRAEEAGVDVFRFADHVDLLAGGEHSDEHEDEKHADEEHADEGADDPHFWLDPVRVADGVRALGDAVAELDTVRAGARDAAGRYASELEQLDREIEAALAAVPADRRKLVTNHEVLRYFADRYDFSVVGAVIPSLTTRADASAADVDELAALIRRESVPAIFVETAAPTRLAAALARSAGDVEIVELYTESLGSPGSGAATYAEMMRTNATRIAQALG